MTLKLGMPAQLFLFTWCHKKNLSAILIPYTNTTSQTLCSKYANLWYVPVDQVDKESCDESGPQDSDIKEKWDRTIFCLNCFALSIFAFCSHDKVKCCFTIYLHCEVQTPNPWLHYLTQVDLFNSFVLHNSTDIENGFETYNLIRQF